MSITNQFKKNLLDGNIQYGIWNGIPDSYAAEMCAGAGFDWVLIDNEHAPFDLQRIIHHMQAIKQFNVPSIVRISSSDPFFTKQLLDAGVQSLLVPMVESVEQAELMAKSMRYPPQGIRGVGTALARAAQWNRVDDYFSLSDDQMCLIVQIESVKGVEALDEILKVDGVDVVFIGPADLAASMGFIGEPNREKVVKEVTECFHKIVAAGKYPGILTTSPTLIEKYKTMGAKMIGVGLDTILLAQATKSLAEKYKPELKDKQSNTMY